jgi:hypothetical protein
MRQINKPFTSSANHLQMESKETQFAKLINLTGTTVNLFSREGNQPLFALPPSNLPLPNPYYRNPGQEVDNPLDLFNGLLIMGMPEVVDKVANLPPLDDLLDKDQYLVVDRLTASIIMGRSTDRTLSRYRERLLVVDKRLAVEGLPDSYYGFFKYTRLF